MAINLDDFELIPVLNSSTIKSSKEETLYDITVEGDHTFFVHLPGTEDDILVHNCDGSHLASMFLGWFKRFAENLFNEGKICKLNIPLVLVIDKNEKVITHFFNLEDFSKWEKSHPQHKYHIEYWKGLGSISKLYLNQLLEKYGFDSFIETYRLDDSGKIYLDHWLNDECIQQRKEYLKNYKLDINCI